MPLAHCLETTFEVIATRPGEVTSFVETSLEIALTNARRYALDGWQCLILERNPDPDADLLEIVMTAEAA